MLVEELSRFDSFSSPGIKQLDSKFKNIQETSDSLFKDLFGQFRDKCPYLFSIISALCVSENSDRNVKQTQEFKISRAVPLISALSAIRNQRSGNDFPVIFGFLIIQLGGGKEILGLLNQFGLTKSYEF